MRSQVLAAHKNMTVTSAEEKNGGWNHSYNLNALKGFCGGGAFWLMGGMVTDWDL